MRPLRRSDAAALLPTLSDEGQCRYLTRPLFESEEELWGWLAEPTWNGRTWIAEDAAGEVAGRFVAIPAHEDGVAEIGYITCAHRQGEGVARECTAALVRHLIGQEGHRKLLAEVDMENAASIRLLERLGFTREALFREHETTHKGLCDVAIYGLLASDPLPEG
ncbi:GNAT family N-acetyltransferase [Qipengyuania sphaerica]|uniref:GNAT family N-acetyltransferase n=1 Tax=Qipengyuania sphaerica TaxID=2867243 RepID=UPI001C8707E3|nr:GNAT family protein [Qipengyuania sphaerica]MBX7541769.1 GNAT family N-acetyltransferase [Qipengyuania sphaerica]